MATSASDYADSFLTRAIASVRRQLDEPTVSAKYTDANIIEQLELSYILALGEKNRNALNPAVATVNVTVASGTTEYILPYTVGSVEAIYESDGGGGRIFYSSRSRYNPLGRFVWIEGNTLKIQATGFLSLGTSLTVEYTPSGVARLHHGVCTINSAGTIATFGATPNVGTMDTHYNAYTGCHFKILNVTGTSPTNNYQQERTISAYDTTTRQATLTPALTSVPVIGDGGEILYEISPQIWRGLDMVVPIHAAMVLAGIEGLSRASSIEKTYKRVIREVRLSAYHSNIQDAGRVPADNFDNRYY